jgi:dihydroorotate dehydrogenase (fumarate)
MTDIKTTYAGLKLKNPVIVGASTLSGNHDNLKLIEDSGASAIVYKSLFEEQIQLEKLELDEDIKEYEERNAEMIHLFPEMEHAGPEEHLINLRSARERVGIPVIASLNCVFSETWVGYSKLIRETGVDAIELNFFSVPRDPNLEGKTILKNQLEILQLIKKAVNIPVTIKLSPFYSNPVNVVKQFDDEGVDGVVLFNRFLQPDIDVDKEIFSNHFSPSNQYENLLPMRFTGLLYGGINASICCNSGIYHGKDVIKMILAGADAVQIVSTLYKNKISHIEIILKELTNWMEARNYHNLDDFKGKLSDKNIRDPFVYKRAQYIDILLKSSEVFKKYPVH